MRFLEYGDKNNKAVILIHGYGISWRMWLPQIEAFSKEYFIIVPVLDGHDTEKVSTFTTVEKAATEIIDHTTEVYGNSIFAICAVSLGATIAVEILAQNRLKVDKAIIDAAPLVPMNKLLLGLSIKMRIKQLHSMKKGSKLLNYMLNRTFYPKELVEEIMKVGANMEDESCINAHLSSFRYSIPASIADIKVDITYWYGSKEAILVKNYARAISSVLPDVKIKVFKGLEHGEFCIGNPNGYIKEVTKFFER